MSSQDSVDLKSFSTLSLRDLLAARELFHLHLMHKQNVVATEVGSTGSGKTIRGRAVASRMVTPRDLLGDVPCARSQIRRFGPIRGPRRYPRVRWTLGRSR